MVQPHCSLLVVIFFILAIKLVWNVGNIHVLRRQNIIAIVGIIVIDVAHASIGRA